MTGTNFKFLDRNPEHDMYLSALIEKYWSINDELRDIWDKARDEGDIDKPYLERAYELQSQRKFIKYKMYNRYHTLVCGDYDRIYDFKRKYLID